MAIKLKWPWLGIVIPCAIIVCCGHGAHLFVFRSHWSAEKQILYEVAMVVLWVSYYLACTSEPGSPPANFEPVAGEWRRWCKKCNNYKPERAHHCKTCKKCVLKMDHHCPWTYNCVGHQNLPHFLRFLFWLNFISVVIIWQLSKRVISYYHDSTLPAYLINKVEMSYVIFFLPVTTLLFLSVLILYIRCIVNMGFKGMTQIEVWEWERVETQFRSGRIWSLIKKNYRILHGKDLPKLVSWSKHTRYYEDDDEEERASGLSAEDYEISVDQGKQPSHAATLPDSNDENEVFDFTIDDLIFPYDLGFWRNITNACGSPLAWLLPTGQPRTLGIIFIKSEYVEDDQLGLPWPPDGGHQESVNDELDNIELEDLSREGRIRKLNRIRDPRHKLKRGEWMNDLGETLDDFGVDVDAEDTENVHLLAN